MQIDRLQIDLHPRPNAQALDLGFALLRSHAATTYSAWLALWLPLIGLCYLLALWFPSIGAGWIFLAWWLKPLVERAPLYVLSRQVFGESVTWQGTVRAWPSQLKGGWFRLLTWWRFIVPGRGLYQAIWQLEGARGTVAAQRRKAIGGRNTGTSAGWYGVVCAHFEAILQIGFIALVGIFVSSENNINPFSFWLDPEHRSSAAMVALTFACYAIPSAIVGPIYTACCFTLYLNRRATLEAWDIELTLRQAAPKHTATSPKEQAATSTNMPSTAAAFANTRSARRSNMAMLLSTVLICALLSVAPSGWAQDSVSNNNTNTVAQQAKSTPDSTPEECEPLWFLVDTQDTLRTERRASHHPAQTQKRKELDALLDTEDLRGYRCVHSWLPKVKDTDEEKEKKPSKPPDFDFNTLATILKLIVIALAIFAFIWLWRRYGHHLMRYIQRPSQAVSATEVGGLDIRPETLPDDVATTVVRLWQENQHRQALALLYRATLSRLVKQDQLTISQGATEGDCIRLAIFAHNHQRLSADKLEVLQTISGMWLRAAYGRQWPDEQAVFALCTRWRRHLDTASTTTPKTAVAPKHTSHLSA